MKLSRNWRRLNLKFKTNNRRLYVGDGGYICTASGFFSHSGTTVASLALLEQKQGKKGLSPQDQDVIEEVSQTIEVLSERINNLEAILDDKHNGWRNQN